MKRMFAAVLLISSMLSGCTHNHFNIPTENFAEKIKVLGVIPIIVDADSDIRHPQKEQLVQIVTDINRKYEQQFVRKLKATGNFYAVALMDTDPQRFLANFMFRREKRDDATVQYSKYFWKNDELRDYLKRNNLDAIMLIVISGLTKNDKIYSSNLLSSLASDYNFLTMTAQILDPNATILWEYPNFRRRFLTYYPLINLQYPDFSEADANLSGKTNLKFKTLEGIQRSLDLKRKDLLLRETQENDLYGKQFNEMLDLLKYNTDADRKDSDQTTEKLRSTDPQPRYREPAAVGEVKVQSTIAPAVELPKPPPAPAVEPPKPSIQPVETPITPAYDAPKLPDNVIVPATGSTL
jgi:hypothetical protein